MKIYFQPKNKGINLERTGLEPELVHKLENMSFDHEEMAPIDIIEKGDGVLNVDETSDLFDKILDLDRISYCLSECNLEETAENLARVAVPETKTTKPRVVLVDYDDTSDDDFEDLQPRQG